MSIRKMISLHPNAGEHVNHPLGDAVHHLMYCAKMCLSCADACMAEKMDMTQCIRLCMDCSDICEATAKLGLIQSKELRITGSIGSPGVWPETIRFLVNSKIDLSPLVTQRFTVDSALEALDAAHHPESTIKAHIEFTAPDPA